MHIKSQGNGNAHWLGLPLIDQDINSYPESKVATSSTLQGIIVERWLPCRGRGMCWKTLTNNPSASIRPQPQTLSQKYTRGCDANTSLTLPQTQSSLWTSVSGGNWVPQRNYCAKSGHDSAQCCVFNDTSYIVWLLSQCEESKNICRHIYCGWYSYREFSKSICPLYIIIIETQRQRKYLEHVTVKL